MWPFEQVFLLAKRYVLKLIKCSGWRKKKWDCSLKIGSMFFMTISNSMPDLKTITFNFCKSLWCHFQQQPASQLLPTSQWYFTQLCLYALTIASLWDENAFFLVGKKKYQRHVLCCSLCVCVVWNVQTISIHFHRHLLMDRVPGSPMALFPIY